MKSKLFLLLLAGFTFGACGSNSSTENSQDSTLTDSVDTGYDATGTPGIDSVTTDDRNDTMGSSATGTGNSTGTGSGTGTGTGSGTGNDNRTTPQP